MDSEELTEALRDAGLSPYQAEAYVALLELGASPATAVAETSSVPDPRIYDVLRDLESQGYVETYQQGSLHARAHDPNEVLSDLRNRAKRFSEAAEEIEERWNRPSMEQNKVSIVKRFDTVLERADALIRSAENQIQICADPVQFERLESALQVAHDDGVDIKLALHTETDDRELLPPIDRLEATCTEARHRFLASPFVALIDREWTCFAPHNRSVNQYGVLVEDRTHTYVFHWFFQTCLWDVWETVHSARSEDPPLTYVDLRQCVRDVEPLLDAGAEILATVEGYDTATGDEVSIRGRLTRTEYTGGTEGSGDERPALSELVGQVYAVIETETDTYSIGGWGAVIEEIEATQITVEQIRERRDRVAGNRASSDTS